MFSIYYAVITILVTVQYVLLVQHLLYKCTCMCVTVNIYMYMYMYIIRSSKTNYFCFVKIEFHFRLNQKNYFKSIIIACTNEAPLVRGLAAVA